MKDANREKSFSWGTVKVAQLEHHIELIVKQNGSNPYILIFPDREALMDFASFLNVPNKI